MSSTCSRCNADIPAAHPAYLVDGAVSCRDCKDKWERLCPYCHKEMKRKLPKSHGKCPSCHAEFHINSEQWFYDTTILTRQQNEGVYDVSKQARLFQPWGVTIEEVARWIAEARLAGDGPAGVFAKIRETGVQRAMAARPLKEWSISQPELELAVHVTERLWHTLGSFVPDLAARSVEAVLGLKEKHGALPTSLVAAEHVLDGVESLVQTCEERSCLLQSRMEVFDLQDRDTKPLRRLWMINEALGYKEIGIKKVQVLACPQSCQGAKALNKKTFLIDDFVRNCPMPVADCTGDCEDDRGPLACRCCITSFGSIEL